MKYIIDTNVPKKAANCTPATLLDKQCSLACLNFIRNLMQSRDILVLDGGGEILKEYRNNCLSSGQDNVATIFLNWVLRNLTLREGSRIETYPITKLSEGSYAEYPTLPNLSAFDPSDKKFIALSSAHPEHPHIVEGSDSLWWGFKDAFESIGIHIIFLCEDYVRSVYEESNDVR